MSRKLPTNITEALSVVRRLKSGGRKPTLTELAAALEVMHTSYKNVQTALRMARKENDSLNNLIDILSRSPFRN